MQSKKKGLAQKRVADSKSGKVKTGKTPTKKQAGKGAKDAKPTKSTKVTKVTKAGKSTKSGKAAKKTATLAAARPGRAYAVRQSAIHGKGMVAIRKIRKGERITEYRGERITWDEAERRYPVDPIPYHTFLFEIGDGSHCLDAVNNATPAKWINHSCKPNCEAEEDEDERVFINALRTIKAGEELTYDYNLTCEESMPLKEKKRRYPCWCGAENCRGTMLGRKRPPGT
jgi:SET domain-containing protein